MKKSVFDWKKIFWVIILVACICINILERISWINYYDKAYDILHIFGYISLIIMIITSILILTLSNKNERLKKSVIAVVMILNLAIGYLTLSEYGYEVTCLSSISKVSLEDGNEHFIINNGDSGNVKVKCDKVTASNITVDKKILYEFDYRYFKYDKENGVLGSIDIYNPIDNR